MWSTRTAEGIASDAGISSDTTKETDAATTYSSMRKNGLALLERIAPKGERSKGAGGGGYYSVIPV